MTPANNIFFLLLIAESILLSLFVGLGKGTHQFSKVLFPLRYQVEVMKNDYQRVVNELSKEEERTMPTRRPTITLFPTLAPAKPTARPTLRVVRKPTAYPTQKPYTYTQPVFPTYDSNWINQKRAESKAWFESESAKSKAAGDAWFAEQVAKQQAEQEAWKKANGL